ncbi:hypothetical protein ACFVYA_33945 [Amycolatopsis sp. NPDC058278]|uniref:hypothetical protein n=1 Tax=Amycolatopsis sp. NPDC058278 TaxID=3346417 RepID=UPI0036DF4ED7
MAHRPVPASDLAEELLGVGRPTPVPGMSRATARKSARARGAALGAPARRTVS